jgi:hypothetical protein
MRVVIINETFSPKMGYIGTMLPKYLSRLGVEVHVIATDLPAYHGLDEFRDGAPDFLRQQSLPAGTVRQMDGYTVHVQAHSRLFGYVRMRQLRQKLIQLKPDVVYCILAIGWMPLEAALLKLRAGYELFTGSHTTLLAFEARSVRGFCIVFAILRFGGYRAALLACLPKNAIALPAIVPKSLCDISVCRSQRRKLSIWVSIASYSFPLQQRRIASPAVR